MLLAAKQTLPSGFNRHRVGRLAGAVANVFSEATALGAAHLIFRLFGSPAQRAVTIRRSIRFERERRGIQMELNQWCVLSVLACTLSGPAMASAVDLSVSGRIQPGACSLTLGNGGTIDMGTLSPKDLTEDKITFFKQHQISMDIRCQAPTKVAFRALDNRTGTALSDDEFGLGASGGKNVGKYYFLTSHRIGDGAELVQLMDTGYGSGWFVSGTTWSHWIGPFELVSWAKPGQTLPQAFQNISSRLEFFITIAPAKDLDLNQEIAIDGSATMELVYL
ncbi:DUF1120 domain-containing protein [Burkholderia sp. SCN-KJ]|uniref:DUF1120 domain-containing protein n=1 Tax=Burkholderia sp. SCN-KJ TaxID=2969248 RepID=UPI00214F7195|nr:DUF1120 domain-containing protein [Burkholderia sp. SCN-KJ]MCR4465554.1 DUF1120 domain-containing protein [Burkholderia sp. SCN-KJ]